MDMIALSGWGQKPDSINNLKLKGAKLKALSYVEYASAEAFFDALPKSKPDILIGWSLGGQLAARLVAAGIIKPKLLVLLGAPYQYLSSAKHPHGVNSALFWSFSQGLKMFPAKTMQSFMTLMLYGDDHMKQAMDKLDIDTDHIEQWQWWLDELSEFSCDTLDFTNFPNTLVVHGDSDQVVPVEQAAIWQRHIKNCRVELIELCGHAPHLHCPEDIKEWMQQELKK